MEKLTKQEEEVMVHIWNLKECSVRDILNLMPHPKPPYTTLASVVKNLERKEYVKPQQKGNTYLYSPIVSESEYKRTFMSGFVRTYFENSYKEMVTFFARDKKLSAKDLKDIIDLIENGEQQQI